MTREDLREQMETRPRIAVHTQLICEDSDFTVPIGPSPDALGEACGAADYSAALEFGSFATPRLVCRR